MLGTGQLIAAGMLITEAYASRRVLEAPECVTKVGYERGIDVAQGRAVKAAIFVQLQAGELPLG